jgi:hypothetical protein
VKYRNYDPADAPKSCPSCIAWELEASRAALLLEALAEDHFPDQATFDEWMRGQMRLTLRGRR